MNFEKSKEVYCMTDDSGNKQDIEKMRLERNLGVIVYDYLKWT